MLQTVPQHLVRPTPATTTMVENMNTYKIVFRAESLAKTFTLTVDKLTFEEAAQSAYLEKHKLGFEYRIVSIRDTGV